MPSSKNPYYLIPAPSGMDRATQPSRLDPSLCQQLQNLLTDRPMQLRGQVQASNVLFAAMPATADGITYYYPVSSAYDLTSTSAIDGALLTVVSGGLYQSSSVPSGFPPQVPTMLQVGSYVPFAVGRRVRAVMFGSEVIFTQDGGLAPQRYNGTYLFPDGLQPPLLGVTGHPLSISITTPGGGNKAGNIYYAVTYVDEKFRESNLGPVDRDGNFFPLLAAYTTAQEGTLSWTGPMFGAAGQAVQSVNLYATIEGAVDTYYQIATFTSGTLSYVDNNPDTTVALGTVGPHLGQNNVPNAATLCAVYKGHVVLDDATELGNIQVSNLNSPTQFSAFTVLATDGLRTAVTTGQGEPITGLIALGDSLGIFHTAGCYELYGSNPTNFDLRPIHTRGCVAPDSLVRCDNVVMFLSGDGVYQAAFNGGYLIGKVSKPIEPLLRNTPDSLIQQAAAAFVENTYYLWIGNTVYLYDFDNNGGAWSTLKL